MTIREEIIACENKLLQAMRDGNLEILDLLLHDDLLFNGPTGETINKEIDLAAARSGNMVVSELVAFDQRISTFDDAAVVTVGIELKGEFMKQPIDGKFRYVRTWKKTGNTWKMIGGGCTPIQ